MPNDDDRSLRASKTSPSVGTGNWAGGLALYSSRILRCTAGPSGCGKSTTLRLLSGLELPDEGRIGIDGQDVTTAAPSDQPVDGFSTYALFPHLNVAENVVFGLKVRKVAAAERRDKLKRALEITGLLGYESRKPGELSGGQRQRVALARAIVANQPLCLMDEPLSNLDAKLRVSVRKDIKKLQLDLGITVVYVTHDQTEAMSMADMVVLMKDGHIQQTGAPKTSTTAQPIPSCGVRRLSPMALIDGAALLGSGAPPHRPQGGECPCRRQWQGTVDLQGFGM